MSDDGIERIEKMADELLEIAGHYPDFQTQCVLAKAAAALYRHVVQCERCRFPQSINAAPVAPWGVR